MEGVNLENLSGIIELLFNKTILFKYKFGFSGEVYIASDEFEDDYIQYKKILEKYFSFKEPFYCNRSKSYYDTDLIENMDLISSIISDTYVILLSDISYSNKQYIIFSLTEYMLSSIAKLLGVSFSHSSLKNDYYIALKNYLSQLTDYLVCIIFDENFEEFPFICSDLLDEILSDMQHLEISEVREYTEMDNILIMFVTYFVYSDYLEMQDVIVSPLQGAALIPPFYISMQKYANSKIRKATEIKYEYVRFSQYDSTHYCQFSLHEQIKVLKNQYPSDIKIILIDDNTGTATTIKAIKQELSEKFTNITTCVLECRWDTKIYNVNYPAFQLNDVDLITPLCYRHYKVFDEQIAYIKNDKKLHSCYKGGNFYKLNMIYNEIDYFSSTFKNRI